MNVSRFLLATCCVALCLMAAPAAVRTKAQESPEATVPPIGALELSEAKEPTLTTKEGLEAIARLAERGKNRAPANDFERLLGWWVVESFAMNGKLEPGADGIGRVELYSRNGEVEIYGSDFWMRQHFVVDVTTEPRRLGTSLTEGFIDDSGIYAFEGDRLKLRESEEPQQLSFDQPPKGDYWDTTLRRLSPEEAQRLLAEREKRLDKLRAETEE